MLSHLFCEVRSISVKRQSLSLAYLSFISSCPTCSITSLSMHMTPGHAPYFGRLCSLARCPDPSTLSRRDKTSIILLWLTPDDFTRQGKRSLVIVHWDLMLRKFFDYNKTAVSWLWMDIPEKRNWSPKRVISLVSFWYLCMYVCMYVCIGCIEILWLNLLLSQFWILTDFD